MSCGPDTGFERAASAAPPALLVRRLGLVPYEDAWRAMRRAVAARDARSADECWFLEHPAVFTLGQAGRLEHLRNPGDIPVVPSDRGGQVTYHGPGQLVAYLLIDLKRRGVGIKRLVHALEQAVIDLAASADIVAERRAGAPGVYVGGRKLAALGLRVRDGRSYHGLALNVNADLVPFERIDPCGFKGLEATSLKRLGVDWSVDTAALLLLPRLAARLGYASEAVRMTPPGAAVGAAAAASPAEAGC